MGKSEPGDAGGGEGDLEGTTKGGERAVGDDGVGVDAGRGGGKRIEYLVDFRFVFWCEGVIVYVGERTGYTSIVCRVDVNARKGKVGGTDLFQSRDR